MKDLDRFFPLIFLAVPLTSSGAFIAGKYAIRDFDPAGIVVIRFIISALVMLPWLLILRRDTHPPFRDRRFLVHLLIIVLTAGIGFHLFFFWAFQYTSIHNVTLFNRPFLNDRATKIRLLLPA